MARQLWIGIVIGMIVGAACCTPARAGLTDGLVSYWTFDEGSGNKAYDSGARGYDGTLTGSGVSWVEGQVGSAVRFAGGSNCYIDCGVASRNITNGLVGMTVSFWAKTEGDEGDVISNGSSYGTHGGTFGAHYDDSGAMFIGHGGSMIGEIWVNGEWHLRTVTWGLPGNTTGSLSYVDGDCKGSTSFPAGPLGASLYNLRFGMNPEWTSDYYNYMGAVDEIAIWDRRLSSDEVAEIYELGVDEHFIGWVAPEPAGVGLMGLALLAARKKRT